MLVDSIYDIKMRNRVFSYEPASEGTQKELRIKARKAAEAVSYCGASIDRHWKELSKDEAKALVEQGKMVLIYHPEFWSVPSGSSGETPCFCLVEGEKATMDKNFRSWCSPNIQAVFGSGTKSPQFYFFTY